MFWILLTVFFATRNQMIDFTLRKYRELLLALQKKGINLSLLSNIAPIAIIY